MTFGIRYPQKPCTLTCTSMSVGSGPTMTTHDVVFTSDAARTARTHLLQHYGRGHAQEDLAFALWRPSTGQSRQTAIIDEIILPGPDDRQLHGTASFEPAYLARALNLAIAGTSGLAFMHSHPTDGWQGMSPTDVRAERDILSYAAGATRLPLVGLTIGTDGYWSARFWRRRGGRMVRSDCAKVRVVGPTTYNLFYNDHVLPPPPRRRILSRTFDTWGRTAQDSLARLHVGIVGLGSVGCIVAEAIARIGVSQITLIDPDRVEEHNLDRLLFGTIRDVGAAKVTLAARHLRRHATARDVRLRSFALSIQDGSAYRAALDCDVLFSCVDRPVPRDVLNYIATAHLIPVIDGGVAVEYHESHDHLLSAHWRAHLVTPYHQCLRCNRQYSSSMVVVELDGSLDDPTYVANLPRTGPYQNQNVFPFSLSSAAMEVNLFLRYLMCVDWWPLIRQQDYQFVTGSMRTINAECDSNCSFRSRRAKGDAIEPPYLYESPRPSTIRRLLQRFIGFFYRGSSTP